MAGKTRAVACSSQRWSELEAAHVHSVYDRIAPCLPTLPQKAWPKVKQFLKELPAGSLVADIGCGNGRYLDINSGIFKLGSDTCLPLLSQAQHLGFHVLVADNLRLPYRDNLFDAVISIGVIHHFATGKRRIQALAELARIMRVGGKVMIYVWAFEQKHRKFESQDILVPWQKSQKMGHKRHHSASSDRSSTSSLSDDDSASIYSFDNLSREPSVASLEAGLNSAPLSRQGSMEREVIHSVAPPLEEKDCPLNAKIQREQLWSECQKLEECLRQLSGQPDEKSPRCSLAPEDSPPSSSTQFLTVSAQKKTLPFRPQSLPITACCQPSQVSAESQLQWSSSLPLKKSLSRQNAGSDQQSPLLASSGQNDRDDGFFHWLKKGFMNMFKNGNRKESEMKGKSSGTSDKIIDAPVAWFAVREFPQSSLREDEDGGQGDSAPAGQTGRRASCVDRAVQTCSPEQSLHSKFQFQSSDGRGRSHPGPVHKSMSEPLFHPQFVGKHAAPVAAATAAAGAGAVHQGMKARTSKPSLAYSSQLPSRGHSHKKELGLGQINSRVEVSQNPSSIQFEGESNGDDAFLDADDDTRSLCLNSAVSGAASGNGGKQACPDAQRKSHSRGGVESRLDATFSVVQPFAELPARVSSDQRGRRRTESDSGLISHEEQKAWPDVKPELCRYYHVFKENELDHLIVEYIPALRILDSYYDHANWCLIAEKIAV